MSRNLITLIAAVAVGICAFFAGFGTELGDTSLSALTDALVAGIEAVVAALVAAIGTWRMVPPGPDEMAK